MAAMAFAPSTLTDAGEPLSLSVARVTSGFGAVMGVQPALGRDFAPTDDVPGQGRVVLMSDHLWRDRFAADQAIVGRTIRLNDRPFTVVGVMPPGFHFPRTPDDVATDIWTPIAEPIQLFRGRHFLRVVARMRPGVTIEKANQDMSLVAADLSRTLPDLNKGHGARVVPLQQDLVRASRASLLLLLGAVTGLLLIGCSNVAGLLVARGIARRPEMAMRLALGASRWSVVRQLGIEGLTLALVASALGLFVAAWLTGLAPSLVPSDVVRLEAVPVDWRVLGFASAAGLVTGVLFAVAPLMQLRSVDLTTTLKAGVRGLTSGGWVRSGLVAGQVALTLILVLAAGVMARGLAALQSIDPGFATTGLLAAEVELSGARYAAPARQRQFFADLAERLRAAPGIVSVGASNLVPLGGGYSGVAIQVAGRPAPAPGEEVSARMRVVGGDYFTTMRIPVRSGRVFAPGDARVAVPVMRWFPQQPQPAGIDLPQPPAVAVINERMARTFWPGQDPIGREFRALFSPALTVVGVVEDTRDETLSTGPQPQFFLYDLQEPQGLMTVLARVNGDPVSAAPTVRAAVRDLDPALAIRSIRPLDEVRNRELGRPRFASWLLGAFGALALILMAAGLYGLMAFTITQQLPEFGVRVALGAGRRSILRLVAARVLRLTCAGIAAGAAGAMVLGPVLRAEFFGARPADPLTWAMVMAVIVMVSLGASWRPARRAATVDPARVLREG
jgi:putative ABC transport system permease protein